jgi:hypothetical protein
MWLSCSACSSTARVEARLRGLSYGDMPAPSLQVGIEWAGVTTLLFLVVPLLIVVFGHREAASSIGWQARGFGRHVWV